MDVDVTLGHNCWPGPGAILPDSSPMSLQELSCGRLAVPLTSTPWSPLRTKITQEAEDVPA